MLPSSLRVLTGKKWASVFLGSPGPLPPHAAGPPGGKVSAHAGGVRPHPLQRERDVGAQKGCGHAAALSPGQGCHLAGERCAAVGEVPVAFSFFFPDPRVQFHSSKVKPLAHFSLKNTELLPSPGAVPWEGSTIFVAKKSWPQGKAYLKKGGEMSRWK